MNLGGGQIGRSTFEPGWRWFHSTDGGGPWTEVPGIDGVGTFGFGAPAADAYVGFTGTGFVVGDVGGAR